MKFRMIASLVALLLSANCLAAFPERAVTLVAPFPAGGAADVIARLLARQLEIQLGKSVIVENKSGAGSVIGAAYVANAKPDGYTILLGSNSTFVLNPALMAKMPYDAAVDFDVLGKIGTLGLALLVNPQVPAKNVAELIALIRANPDKYSYASYGNGTTSNFAGAMFNSVTGLNVMHIPYKGSTPAMNDTIGGQVPMAYDTILATTPQDKAGRIRALAVTSLKRSPLLPDVPTLAESGLKDFNVVAWQAIVGPKGLPADVKAVLQKALKAVIEDPAVVEKMATTGFDISWNPADDWTQMVRAEIAEAKDIAAKAKITAD
ncbi:MAG: tripartite tricarboxylate transporter substrate binding protein [Alcaligenaceae bacterium]